MDDAFGSKASPIRPLGLLAESREILVEAIDAGPLQTRAKLDEAAIQDFAERMEAGDEFPPLLCFRVEGRDRLVLVGGHHRFAAMCKLGKPMARCVIREGTWWDAMVASARDNDGAMQVRITNQDKRHRAEMALRERSDLTDRAIGDQFGLTHKLVGRVRQEMEACGTLSQSETRTAADGRVVKVAPRETTAPPVQAVTQAGQVKAAPELGGPATSYVQPSTNGQLTTTTPEPAVSEPQPSSTTPEPSSTVGAIPGATGEVDGETVGEDEQSTDTLSVPSASEPSLARAEAAAKVRSRVGEICRRAVALEQCLGQHPLPVREAAEQSRALKMATQVFNGDFEKLMAAA